MALGCAGVDFAGLLRQTSGMTFSMPLKLAAALRSTRPMILLAAAFLLLSPSVLHAQVAFESGAEQALLIDYATGTVLYEKKADEEIIPASMTKLMTIEILFDEIASGRLKLTDQMTASENAWRNGGAPAGGSAMMLVPNARPTVEDLIRGLIVISGNDAAITVAEGISGSEKLFAERMTSRGKELGLKNSVFRNATGFAAEGQHSTLRDLARLAEVLIRDHARFYPYFKETEFTWNKTKQQNRNPLLTVPGLGADGLKTGFLESSGYGLVGSAVQDGRRLIVVVHGLTTLRDRSTEAVRLLEWGFRNFEERTLFAANAPVAEVEVHGGASAKAAVSAIKDIRLLLPRGDLRDVTVEVRYKGPVPAPISKGQEIARLVVLRAGTELATAPLQASDDVAIGSLTARFADTAWGIALTGIRSLFSQAGAQ